MQYFEARYVSIMNNKIVVMTAKVKILIRIIVKIIKIIVVIAVISIDHIKIIITIIVVYYYVLVNTVLLM